jgi:hypothetical protein
MEDPSRGPSENVLKQRTRISFYCRKLNVQGERLKTYFDAAGEVVTSFIRIQWVPQEE